MKNIEHTKKQLIKELEESLQTNEFLSLLLESMPVAVYTCEAGGDFGATYISNNITALTGYKPENFTSHSEFWFSNVHPDDAEMVNMNIATLLETGHITYEYRWRLADGSYKWFYDISKLMKTSSGESSYILGTFIDITDRKKVEEELKFRSGITEQLNVSVITTGLDFKINWVNQAFSFLYGYSSEEVIGQTPDFLNIDPLLKEIQKDIYQTVSSGRVWSGEAMNRRKDGTTFPCELDIFPLKDEKGNIFAYVGHQRDITERKKAEVALQKSHDELELRVRERTSELQEKNIALKVLLKQREEDKNELEQNILSNIKSLVQPHIIKLKRNNSNFEDNSYLNLIESNLEDIVSPFSQKLSSNYMSFSSKEIQIANLIKEGKKDKEIMEIMDMAIDTVKAHRKNIRKKLGITGTGTNLRNKLLSM